MLFLGLSGGLQIIVTLLGWVITRSDPTDPVVYAHRKALVDGYLLLRASFDATPYPSVCTICNTCVQGDSKHCGSCNRCVMHFDHHCKWLNNCIGGQNYSLFVALLAILATSQLAFCTFSSLFIYETTKTGFADRCREYSGWDSRLFIVTLVSVALLVAVVTLLGVSNLIGLHLWLRKVKRMTTYEYILSQRKAAKYRPGDESDRMDISDSGYQLPLVEKAHGRVSSRVAPEDECDLHVTPKCAEIRTDGVARNPISPLTDMSAIEGRRGAEAAEPG